MHLVHEPALSDDVVDVLIQNAIHSGGRYRCLCGTSNEKTARALRVSSACNGDQRSLTDKPLQSHILRCTKTPHILKHKRIAHLCDPFLTVKQFESPSQPASSLQQVSPTQTIDPLQQTAEQISPHEHGFFTALASFESHDTIVEQIAQPTSSHQQGLSTHVAPYEFQDSFVQQDNQQTFAQQQGSITHLAPNEFQDSFVQHDTQQIFAQEQSSITHLVPDEFQDSFFEQTAQQTSFHQQDSSTHLAPYEPQNSPVQQDAPQTFSRQQDPIAHPAPYESQNIPFQQAVPSPTQASSFLQDAFNAPGPFPVNATADTAPQHAAVPPPSSLNRSGTGQHHMSFNPSLWGV